jgi:aspartate beta-hydroxylase
MNDPDPEELVRRAEISERTAQPEQALALWSALVTAYPGHPKALFVQARRCIERGDPRGGLGLLSQAEQAGFRDADGPLYAALAHRMLGANDVALAAIDRALAIDPLFFMALLSKGAILEALGQPRAAARVYSNALKIAPAMNLLTPAQRAACDHARQAIDQNAKLLAEHLRQRTAALRDRFRSERLDRFEQSVDILAGVKPRYTHDPALLYFPQLPAIPFFDRELFPWLPQLEAATDSIRQELLHILRAESAEFAPYIQVPPEAPVNQWAQLNFSPAWSTHFFWRDGVRNDHNCERCPRTAALLAELPLAHQAGYGPTAMFSALSPGAHIPAHTGSSNTRLIVHLPLLLPHGCSFRVGPETRAWRPGEAWVFDDTIEHEAWNHSDQIRIILIFDVWNPLLSEAERLLVCEMMAALREYNAS